MKRMILFLALPFALHSAALAASTWTNTAGVTIEGDFVRLEGGTVTLRKDGKDYRVPLSKLSPASREQARRMAAAPVESVPVAAADPRPAPPPGEVTTTTLPDPFPNCAPRVTGRQAVVESGRPGRTPSVVLGQYDVELDPLQVRTFTQPAHGKASLNADGTFTYQPKAGYLRDDEFTFTLDDGRGGSGTATMRIRVIPPGSGWSATWFTGLSELQANGQPIGDGKGTVVVRVTDWNDDGKLDLLVAENGGVRWHPNRGSAKQPDFGPGEALVAGGKPVEFGGGRLALALADLDRDGLADLVVVPASDRKPRWLRRGPDGLAAPALLRSAAGGDLVLEDVRCEVADWNGDGRPDFIVGAGSGAVKVLYQTNDLTFAAPDSRLDRSGSVIQGGYNINLRVLDLNADGLPDLVNSWNWGNIQFRLNNGTASAPSIPADLRFAVAGKDGAEPNLHQLTDGPIPDFADLDGDGTVDLIIGGEARGRVRFARGRGGDSYLREIAAMIASRPADLGTWLADPANSAEKDRLTGLLAALYDFVAGFATPGQRQELRDGLARLIAAHPDLLRRRKLDIRAQPGMPSLAAQLWLTLLLTGPDDPAVRRQLAEVAGFTGAYRKLLEDIGVIYLDNEENPRGAEAIWQWLRTIPREVYPGNGITAADWLGGKPFLPRGHLKNTFNGAPVDGGEFAFGGDARPILGDRGSENWFMTVVKHEVCHDVDAYVRGHPRLDCRWRKMLLDAGGPHLRADPRSGAFSWELTKQHFREMGFWNGEAGQWDAAWKEFWESGPGKPWNEFGFMRGNIGWILSAPQESLATQGNQHWNTTEGRLQVAIDRFRRGFPSNLGEVLFFLEIWSVGLDKVRFSENDNANNQVFRYAKVRRNAAGWIDRIDLGERAYEFKVDAEGTVTDIILAPSYPHSSNHTPGGVLKDSSSATPPPPGANALASGNR